MIRTWLKQLHKGQKGFGLAETLVAVAILGTSVAAFVIALSTGSLSVNELEQQTTAQRLAQAQLEYIKSCAYEPGATTYPVITAPPGHAISVNVNSVAGADADIQEITVIIFRDSENIFEISDYKVNR